MSGTRVAKLIEKEIASVYSVLGLDYKSQSLLSLIIDPTIKYNKIILLNIYCYNELNWSHNDLSKLYSTYSYGYEELRELIIKENVRYLAIV